MRKFLHILIFTLIFALALCISISAEAWTDEGGRTWTFTKNDTDHTSTITGANLKTGEERTSELNIPAKVFVGETEYTVTKIGASAFKCGSDYKSGDTYLAKKYFGHVTIPNTVVEIGNYAFEYSAIYGELNIPESVTKIGEYAFRGCVGLDTVNYSKTMDSIPVGCFDNCKALVKFETEGVIKNYGASCFRSCEALLYIEISPETLTIGGSAFQNCYCLSGSIDLSKATSIGGGAFQNCYFIESVKIGGACNFDTGVFSNCKALKAFIISEEHTKYCSVDGVLFSKDMKTLYKFPLGKLTKSYVVPDSVETVSGDAFYGATILTSIKLGSGLKSIGNNAFRNTGIITMYVPDNVTSVGSAAFHDCQKLEWIVFGKGVTSFRSDFVKGDLSALKYVFTACDKNTTLTNSGGFPGGEKFNYYIEGRLCDDHYGGHKFGYLDTPATCDEPGENICCFCRTKVEVAPLGHVGQIIRVSKLSCTTNESITIRCINCGLDNEVISAAAPGHTLTTVQEVTEDKYSYSYSKCTACGFVKSDAFSTSAYTGGDINDDGVIDAKDIRLLGRIISGSASTANKFACDINGDGKIDALDLLLLKQHVAELGETIKKNENTCASHIHITTVTVYREDCDFGGLYISFCADCGALIDEEHTESRGHIFIDTVLEQASCSKAGRLSRDCSVCDYLSEEEIPSLPHTQSWWMLSDNELEYEYSYCKVCGTLEHREVNRAVLQEIVKTIPKNYAHYCTAESAALLKPIVDNAEKALTQEQVDKLIEDIRQALPTLQYKVHDVPVVYVEMAGKLTAEYSPANIIVAYRDNDGNLQTLTDSEGQMKIRGNSTAGISAKQPFNIKFSRDVDLFGMFGDKPDEKTAPGKKYRLLANALDTSLLRNAVAFEFAEKLGLEYTCKYRFVDVHVDGVFKGCYMLTSTIDISPDSVDIDEERDVIIHLSKSNGSNDAAFPSPIFGLYLMRLEEPEEYTAYTRSQMMRIMYQLDFAILSGDIDEMAKFMDIDSMLAYFLFHEYVKDMDMIWDSTRFYIEDGKLHGGPAWDLDISQGNIRRDSNGNGFDERSAYHYWNQEVVYGDIVTRAELNALGEFGSAIGPWVDAFWANDRSYGTSNPSLANGQRRWWFSYMVEYSNEFMVMVAEYIRDNQDLFKSMYDTNLIDPNTGRSVKCLIDELAFGEKTGEALARNYTDGPFGSATHPNSMVFCEDNTHSDAVIYLRGWWKVRAEWLYNYYTETYLTPTESATN